MSPSFFEFLFYAEEPPQLLAGNEFSPGSPKRYNKSNSVVILEIKPSMIEFFNQDFDVQVVTYLKVASAFVAQFKKYFTLASGELVLFGLRNILKEIRGKFRSLASIVWICQQMARPKLKCFWVFANAINLNPRGHVPAPIC